MTVLFEDVMTDMRYGLTAGIECLLKSDLFYFHPICHDTKRILHHIL